MLNPNAEALIGRVYIDFLAAGAGRDAFRDAMLAYAMGGEPVVPRLAAGIVKFHDALLLIRDVAPEGSQAGVIARLALGCAAITPAMRKADSPGKAEGGTQ